MKKEDLHARCNELGIKYQENDTNEQLALMIAGKEAAAKLKTKDAEIQDLKTSHEEALKVKDDRIAELETEAKEAATEIENMQKVVDDSVKVKELALAGSKTANLPTVKHKGKEYQIQYPKLRIGTTVVTAQEVADDSKLIASLLKEGSGMLKEIVESVEE